MLGCRRAAWGLLRVFERDSPGVYNHIQQAFLAHFASFLIDTNDHLLIRSVFPRSSEFVIGNGAAVGTEGFIIVSTVTADGATEFSKSHPTCAWFFPHIQDR